MTVEAKLDQIIAALAALPPATPVDMSGLAISAEVAALSAQVTALAAIVGTEATSNPAHAPNPVPVSPPTS